MTEALGERGVTGPFGYSTGGTVSSVLMLDEREVAERFDELAVRVADGHEEVVILRDGRPAAKLVKFAPAV